MKWRECFDGRRQVKGWSFLIGFPLALLLVLLPSHKDWPAVAGVVIPFAAVIGVEWFLRLTEWAFYRVRNLHF